MGTAEVPILAIRGKLGKAKQRIVRGKHQSPHQARARRGVSGGDSA